MSEIIFKTVPITVCCGVRTQHLRVTEWIFATDDAGAAAVGASPPERDDDADAAAAAASDGDVQPPSDGTAAATNFTRDILIG